MLAAAFAAVVGLIAYAIVTAAAHGGAIDAQVRSLTGANATLQQQIDERRTQIGEANNPDWLQEQARKLGFVFPGETIFILTTPGVSAPPGGGVNAVLPTYAPSPSPTAKPSPGSSAAVSPSAAASATPLALSVASPTPH